MNAKNKVKLETPAHELFEDFERYLKLTEHSKEKLIASGDASYGDQTAYALLQASGKSFTSVAEIVLPNANILLAKLEAYNKLSLGGGGAAADGASLSRHGFRRS